jgi:hypothetical protein
MDDRRRSGMSIVISIVGIDSGSISTIRGDGGWCGHATVIFKMETENRRSPMMFKHLRHAFLP